MESAEIGEVLRAAECYLQKLKDLDEEIKIAQAQISTTTEEAESGLLGHFSTLHENVTKLIMKRKCQLIEKILSAREEGMIPLNKCSLVIENKIEDTEKLISLAKMLAEGRIKDVKKGTDKLFKRSSLIGALPEIPPLKEVPYITFEYDSTLESEIEEIISNYGTVTKIAPVQILQMTEKPGAILVEWHIVDLEDKAVDIQEFCLQKATGDALLNNKLTFETCYQGVDSQFLVKDLKVDEIYSFRVSCKFEGSTQLSRWSLIQKSKTSLKPFAFRENGHYSMTADCKIAKPLATNIPCLISNGPQFKVGYTIEFTILEKDDNIGYLGITTTKVSRLSSIENPEGSFILNSEGEIKVDGLRKSTHLPNFQKGAKISFCCECMKDDRVVVHIDLNEKRVTYEWGVSKTCSFYFAAELPSTSWKIMVE